MTKFAPVAPIRLLKLLKEESPSLLGKYHLVLAHDICENSKQWENFLPPGSTVIIDNSVIELGYPVAWEVMKQAYDILGPDLHRVIVLPDRFDDSETTALGSVEYLGRILDKTLQAEYMYVIQAKELDNVDRAIRLADSLLVRSERVRWIAIPRRIQYNFGSRIDTLQKAKRLYLKIHLMGFSNSIKDDLMCARDPGVEGIDSTVPLRLGQQGASIDLKYEGDQAGPREGYWIQSHTVLNPQTVLNIKAVRDAINPGDRI